MDIFSWNDPSDAPDHDIQPNSLDFDPNWDQYDEARFNDSMSEAIAEATADLLRCKQHNEPANPDLA